MPRTLPLAWLILLVGLHGSATGQALLCGDCNSDGQANILDALLAAQHAVSIVTLVGVEFAACNVAGTPGGDSVPGATVDVLDALGVARYAAAIVAMLSCQQGGGGGPTLPWDTGSYFPAWQSVAPLRTLSHTYDPMLNDCQNGSLLADAILALQPGDRLEIGTGTYCIDRWFNVVLTGTAAAPIWVVAAAGATPVLTRPDAMQNVINLAASAGSHTEFLCLRGLEITGGDTLVKLYSCSQVWIDQCHIHDGSGVGIAANSADTDHLHITRNHIHDPGMPGDTAEGMYLGANSSAQRMSYSIVALNHVHDTGGTQGDGIEIKQGSYNNWVAENEVHDCNYPCLIAYGTDGLGINLIERNVLYRSNDNTMQVQGEAIIRNNLIIGGNTGFQSQDHQGMSVDLEFVHNTVLNVGRATNLTSWNGRTGMVLANNVLYSQTAESIRFPSGSAGVSIAGNVVLGPVTGTAAPTIPGTGLADFANASWDGTTRDATPVPGSPPIGAADPTYLVPGDVNGTVRVAPHESGAFDAP